MYAGEHSATGRDFEQPWTWDRLFRRPLTATWTKAAIVPASMFGTAQTCGTLGGS